MAESPSRVPSILILYRVAHLRRHYPFLRCRTALAPSSGCRIQAWLGATPLNYLLARIRRREYHPLRVVTTHSLACRKVTNVPSEQKQYPAADVAAVCARFRKSMDDLIRLYPELILVEDEFEEVVHHDDDPLHEAASL